MDLLREKMRLLPMSGPQDMGGGGGSAPAPAQSQTTTQDLPDWAKGYAQRTLAKGEALTSNAYQPYTQQRISGFTPLQEQAFQGASQLGPTAQTAMGSGLAAAAGVSGLGQNYQTGRFQGGQFTPMNAAQYMSPFVQQALEPQLYEAQRASDIIGQQQRGQAVASGAYGGSRQALIESERQRNLAQQLGAITGKGYQTAYEQAANQFNQDMARRMQAQQLGEQSRQFGANLGLQGLQTGLQAAGTLGTLGQQQFGQQQGAIQAQSAAGAQQQALQQKSLDTAYQDYLTQLNYPYQQLSYMANLIRGTPMGMNTQSQVYQAPGSQLGQLAGLGMMGYGLTRMAEGGEVKGYAGDQGSVTSEGFEKAQLSRMNPEQLATVKHNALMRRDLPLAQLVDEVMAENQSLYAGLGGAFNQLSPDQQDNIIRAAGGGILAFAGNTDGSLTYSDPMGTGAAEMTADTPATDETLLERLGIFNPANRRALEAGEKRATMGKGISAYARGQDSTDAEAGIPMPSTKGSTKTGAKTPGVTTSPAGVAPAKEASFADDVEMARKMLTNPQDAEDRKALNDLIAQYGTRAGELKKQSMNDFLINYGGALAQSAAQPGMGGGLQGALRSAAAAAPAGAKSIMDTRSAIAKAQDTNLKMQLEMRKYNIAESKNDRAAMVSAAQNIRMMRQQQAQLNEVIRHNKASEGLMGQRIAAAVASGAGQRGMLTALGRAEDRAVKATGDYLKSIKGMQDKRSHDEILDSFRKKFGRGAAAGIGFGPTGNMYDDDEEA